MSRRNTSQTSSIGDAMAEMDYIFNESDNENEAEQNVDNKFLPAVQEGDENPTPHPDTALDGSSDEIYMTLDDDDDGNNIHHEYNVTDTFNIDVSDVMDIVDEVERADQQYQELKKNKNKRSTMYDTETETEAYDIDYGYHQHHDFKNEEKEDDDDDGDTHHNYDFFQSQLGQNKQNLSQRTHEKELINDIIERLKVALTFLLHYKSPLNKDKEIKDRFYHSCKEYNVEEDDDFELYQAKINHIYKKSYKYQHELMWNQWTKWQQYANKIVNDKNNGKDMNMQQTLIEAHRFMEDQETVLEDICDSYIFTKSVLKKPHQSLIATFASRTVTTRHQEMVELATLRSRKRSSSNPKTRSSTQRSSTQRSSKSVDKNGETQRNDINTLSPFNVKRDIRLSRLQISTPEDELKLIQDRSTMKEWIEKYKFQNDLISKAFSCCNKKYNEDDQRELDTMSPMDTWNWQNVVAFVEASEELRHLASVFWQYRINGRELCKMGPFQIELLVECSVLHNLNIIEDDFDRLKAHSNKQWALSDDAEKLVYYKDKSHIQSHVVSRYHLAIDTLHDIINSDAEHEKYKDVYYDATMIADMIQLLRANPIDGGKEYWKIDVYFFDKIDNYLAVLISDDIIREMYQKCFIDFLIAPDKPSNDYVQQLMKQNANKKRALSPLDKINNGSFFGLEYEPPLNSKQQSKNTIKSITTQLNMISSNQKEVLEPNCCNKCCDKICCKFVRSTQESVYLPLLFLTIITLLCTSLFIIIWFYSHGLRQQTDYIQLTIDSMGERTRNAIVGEFWVPQMLMSLAIGGLYNGDFNINASKANDKYAQFFMSFDTMPHTEAIFSLGLYNGDDNSLYITYRRNDNSMIISNFNGTCRKEIPYGSTPEYIENAEANCDYSPPDRPWHQLAVANIDKAIWTEPYLFVEGYFGMSLVAAFEFEGTLLIFLCEIRVDTLSTTALSKNLILPKETVVMIATPDLDIIASSTDDIYLANGTKTDEPLIVSTAKYLKENKISGDLHESAIKYDEENEYSVSIFSFEMIYLNFIPTADQDGNTSIDELNLIKPLLLNDPNDYQYGYIVVANGDTYLNNVDLAFVLSWFVLGFILTTTTTLICVNMKYHDQGVGRSVYKENMARMRWLKDKRESNNSSIHKSLELSSRYRNNSNSINSSMLQSMQSSTTTTLNDINPMPRQKVIRKKPQIGDKVTTKDGITGIIKHKTKLLEDSSFSLIGLELNDGTTIFTNYNNLIIPIHNTIHNTIHSNEMGIGLNPIEEEKTDGVNDSDPDLAHLANSFRTYLHVGTQSKIDEVKTDETDDSDNNNNNNDNDNNDNDNDNNNNNIDDKFPCFHLTQQQLLIASFCQILFMILFLIGIWVVLLNTAKSDLVQNIMAKQEWGSVKDGVMDLYEKSEMILSIYKQRFERGDFEINDDFLREKFLSNLMQSFVGVDPTYSAHYTYLGTPDGRFLGVGWADNETSYKLRTGTRNQETDFILKEYILENNGKRTNDEILELEIYDPRCRIWYQNAMKYTFNGTINQAFPNNNLYNLSFDEFVGDKRAVSATENCRESRIRFATMFDIELSEDTKEIISNYSDYDNNKYEYNPYGDTEDNATYKLVWSRYIFFSLGQIGLTASAAIQDPINGDLFGVLGIDFTLGQLSTLLYNTVKQHESSSVQQLDNKWYSWVFDTNLYQPEMIASSEFTVLRNATSSEGCFGISQSIGGDQETKIPYLATSHPKYEIRISSNEINVTGMLSFDKNANESTSIDVPINFPMLEAGRIVYPPGGQASIDWIVAKTVSDETSATVDSIQVTFFVAFTFLAMTLFVMKEFDFIQDIDDMNDMNDEDKKDPNYYYKLMLRMKPIIMGSANCCWKQMVNNNDKLSDFEININIITTNQAKKFMANRANEHIAAENKNELKFIECAWEASLNGVRTQNKKFRLNFFRFIESNLYGFFNQIFLFLHLVASLFEPSTPKELKLNGLSNSILSVIGFCIIMEWLDVFLIIYRRYIEFSIAEPFLTQLYEVNYGLNHKYTKLIKNSKSMDRMNKRLYLVFFGPRSTIFLIHCTLNTLILFNFITRVYSRTGYLSYYLPILPVLLLIRNETVLEFSKDFIFAVLYAKDVLFSYMCFILIFAIFSMSLFRTVVNPNDFSESFETIAQAVITAFVYISTSENYTFMYDVFDAEYYKSHNNVLLINATFISLTFAMVGLFIFIPMIIHRFELAFEESRILKDQNNIASKENAIIAAFILLDMNGDLDIDKNEFQSLVSSSILLDKNKLFDAFDENQSGGININEFVLHLLKQTFRTKIMSTWVPQQNKIRAWFECNLLRHRYYKTFILVLFVMPFLMISLLKGVSNSFSETNLNYLLYCFFILNLIEIHFNIIIYGISRYWDLLKYPNPNYVAWAINRYQAKNRFGAVGGDGELDGTEIIRLTSSEKGWAAKHLQDTRPLSILEKSTLTLIHKLLFTIIWGTLITFSLFRFGLWFYDEDNNNNIWKEMNERYCMYFIQFGVLSRMFFLIPSNQKLIYVIFSVFPQFLSLFAFLGLFMYSYARIGCTLFGDNITDVVTPGVYEQASAMKTNFNSLSFSMLALLQLMVGEGWHEIMYYNVIATHPGAAIYFIGYITAVTIIISNVFVGLFLADIDSLTTEQANDDILVNSHKEQSFEQYANYKLNILNYQIKMDDIRREKMQKQIDQIELLLYHHKLKIVQNQYQ